MALPGVQSAENYYGDLSSGDPTAIARAIAPIAQQADTAAASAKANILQNVPAGGEKNLALEQVDVNRGAQVGNAASQGYTSAFQSLGALGGQNIGQSQSAAGLANSGYSSAGGMALQEQQLQIQQKGNTLGAIGGLAGDATSLGSSAITANSGGKGGGGSDAGAIAGDAAKALMM